MAFLDTVKKLLYERRFKKAFKRLEKFYALNKGILTPEAGAKIKALRAQFEKESMAIDKEAAERKEVLFFTSMGKEISILEELKHGI